MSQLSQPWTDWDGQSPSLWVLSFGSSFIFFLGGNIYIYIFPSENVNYWFLEDLCFSQYYGLSLLFFEFLWFPYFSFSFTLETVHRCLVIWNWLITVKSMGWNFQESEEVRGCWILPQGGWEGPCPSGALFPWAGQFSPNRSPPRSRWAVIILGEQGQVEERTGLAESKQTSHLTSHSLFSA